MITRKHLLKDQTLCASLFLLPTALAHMQMSWPYPVRSSFNPANNYSDIDYSMTDPLNADGSNFPCKGYQNDRPIQTTATYIAGSTYNVTLAGSAMHGGGSCQLSLSYDNGATFRVIKSMIGGCPLNSTYPFTIPNYAPQGTALFAWTWQNYEGNREFYMNCAEVNIELAPRSRRQQRQAYTSFEQLPYIWKANVPGVNNCTTTEAETPIYPHPGPDVLYGGGVTAANASTPGDCDAPAPFGPTYRDLEDTETPDSSSSGPATTFVPTNFSYDPTNIPTTSDTVPTTILTSTWTLASTTAPVNASTSAYSHLREAPSTSVSYATTTVSIECPDTVTITVYPDASSTTTVTALPSYYMTAAASACTGTSASCPCAAGYQCSELSPCTWACNNFAAPTSSSPISPRTWNWSRLSRSWTTYSRSWSASWSQSTWHPHSTVVVTQTGTVIPIQTGSSSPSSQPDYATGDLSQYLPCVPGTFICTSSTTWQTCDYDQSSTWVYDYPRDVSDGMECLPYLSPYTSSTSHYEQQAKTPNGYYRDDRVVRARPDGSCDADGSFQCTDSGQTFDICDQGGWVRMGPVASGTVCRNGAIVGAS